jgi:hypothetical protein
MRRVSACPACGRQDFDVVVQAGEDERQRFIAYSRLKYGGVMDDWLQKIELAVVRCPTCEHHWYLDQPDDHQLLAMYDASRSFFGNTTVDREPNERMRREMRSLRRLFKDEAAPALLDYGSGFGRWARAARAQGFEVCAYEPSEARGREEQQSFKVVHRLDDLAEQRFSVINLEQVLEHVPTPIEVLVGLKKFCAANTVVRVAVPSLLRSHEGETIWDEWPFNGKCVHTMAPFEHLHGFTPASLERVVIRAGFRLLSPFRTMRSHPPLLIRRFAGRIWSRLGNTSVLAQVAH